MSTKIGYFIPEFPGQTHIFFWREMKALREIGVEPAVVSTRVPERSIIVHTWAEEARRETRYLFPPGPRAILGALWTLLRAGPLGWWRAAGTFLASEGSFSSRCRLLLLLFFGAELAWLARRDGWAHVHVHSCGDAANVAMFARRLTGLPYSLTLHGPLRDYGPNQKQKWVHSSFALVITRRLQNEVRRDLAGFLPSALDLAPMGVDLKRFERAGSYAPWTGSGPVRLFACGRLNPCKGHDDLLRAVSKLREQGLDVRLQIAGADDVGGACREGLERLRDELRLGENIRLLGAVSEEEVRKGLAESHAFVLASLEEPLGVAIMEAMALNVPVVVTGTGGVPELVDDGVDGLLVPPRDPGTMAAALLKLLRDPDLAARLSRAARLKIESSFHSGVGAAALRRGVHAGPAAAGLGGAP
jgi:glycosyltransferase involved in cell wall biosynthesis